MGQASSAVYVPSDQFSAKIDDMAVDSNVILIPYSILSLKTEMSKRTPLLCKGCTAVFNCHSKLITQDEYYVKMNEQHKDEVPDDAKAAQEEEKDNKEKSPVTKFWIKSLDTEDKAWICEFCGTHNEVKKDWAEQKEDAGTNQEEVTYLLEQAQVKTTTGGEKSEKEEGDDTTVVFCIDISGSMNCTHEKKSGKGGFVSRIQAVSDSIVQQIEEMKTKHPKRKVALVTFSKRVNILGDCEGEKITLTEKENNDFDALFQFSSQNVGKYLKNCISESHEALRKTVAGLEPSGSTALGPALLSSIGLASNGSLGSQVIVCTDGLANEGLGNLENQSHSEAAKKFYDEVGDLAVQYNIMINMVTIKGTACRLDALGPLTDRTSGAIIRVDPDNLDLSEFTQDEVLATQVELKVLLHEGLAFKNEKKENIDNGGSMLVKQVGNVTKKNETTVEYRVKTSQELKDLGLNLENLKEIPAQAQLRYFDKAGNKYLRVISRTQPLTNDREVAEKNVRVDILTNHMQKQAASLALDGDIQEAQKKTKAWNTYMSNNIQKNSNDEAGILRFQQANQMLDDVVNQAGKSNDQAKKDDVNGAFFNFKKGKK